MRAAIELALHQQSMVAAPGQVRADDLPGLLTEALGTHDEGGHALVRAAPATILEREGAFTQGVACLGELLDPTAAEAQALFEAVRQWQAAGRQPLETIVGRTRIAQGGGLTQHPLVGERE